MDTLYPYLWQSNIPHLNHALKIAKYAISNLNAQNAMKDSYIILIIIDVRQFAILDNITIQVLKVVYLYVLILIIIKINRIFVKSCQNISN